MTKATLTKTIGTVLSILLSGAAVYFHNNLPVASLLAIVSTNIVSWLHLPTPGTVRLSDVVPVSNALPPSSS
jgi:hypothetical protein